MVTKSVTLEIDAYERLRSAKRPGESISDVVRRAVFDTPAPNGAELLAYYRNGGGRVSVSYLDSVERVANTPFVG